MTQFDHEKLDVYKVSLEFNATVTPLVSNLNGIHRHNRDQLIRSAQSILLNIAEGNGKRSTKDRIRYFEIARGSAMESAGALDLLVATKGASQEQVKRSKELLHRVVSMLSRMTDTTRNDYEER